MPTDKQSAILKEMGITQWVLRDPPDTAPATEPSQPQKAPEADTDNSPAETLTENVETTSTPVASTPVDTKGASLAQLREQVAACTACGLAKTRTNTVFGEGPDQADWLWVGEAPGQQEDRQGRPFVGRAGQLLTQMIRALDETREHMFIANTLKCRPPNNRDPLPEELKACEPFLLQQIECIQPKVMVALGRFSAQALLQSDQSLGRLRGQVYHYGPRKTPLIVTYHPAYLLRNPADKVKVWEDLLLAHQQIKA